MVEYKKIRDDFDQKTKELKVERVRLMEEKIREKTGQSVQIKMFGNLIFVYVS